MHKGSFFIAALMLFFLLASGSCLPKPPAEVGGINITLYGYSIMKESLEKALCLGGEITSPQRHRDSTEFTQRFFSPPEQS